MIQKILASVEHPSRYLGTEINRHLKAEADVKLRMALVFPDLYEIGTSHFGMQILYHLLNADPEISAERVFMPAPDFVESLRAHGLALPSLETQRPIHQFDIIGFSLLYELNYTNVLAILQLGNIPFFSRERGEHDALIIAGGPCTCNPEPVADFFDAMVIGDGESVIMEMTKEWMAWKKAGGGGKEPLLRVWSRIEGVYVPSFYTATYDEYGFQRLRNRDSLQTVNEPVARRAIIRALDETAFPEKPVVPYGKPVHDRLRLEISRGCTRGCRFCQAGMIYRPVRERSPESLVRLSEVSLNATGYDNISLLSLSTGDYRCIGSLLEELMIRNESRQVAVSFPSLRADTLTPEMMKQIKRVRKTGFTIAPEAGSQRLRNIINKNITKEEIARTVQNAFDLGWQVIKLYFMIGLPFEQDDDLNDLIDLVKELRRFRGLKKGGNHPKGKIHMSVATFIPKPHTPFQWAPQISIAESKEKIEYIRKSLKLPGIEFKWQNPEVSILEGLWARGDRRLSGLLKDAYGKGCLFDGWSDRFDYKKWMQSVADTGVNIDFFTTRKRNVSEPFPWDHIDIRISKEYLEQEWNRAKEGETTPDCRFGGCGQCGSCDFDTIEPVVFSSFERPVPDPELKTQRSVMKPDERFHTYRIVYSKKGEGRFFGHLEMVRLILQAIRRAGIPVRYTEGFQPKPKISFDDPLPIGMESEGESFYMRVPEGVLPQKIVAGLNNQLPEGLEVIDCLRVSERVSIRNTSVIPYRITLMEGEFSEDTIEAFKKARHFPIVQKSRKGELKKQDLKDIVLKIERISPDILGILVSNESGKTVRPADILSAVFNLSTEAIRRATVVKLMVNPLESTANV